MFNKLKRLKFSSLLVLTPWLKHLITRESTIRLEFTYHNLIQYNLIPSQTQKLLQKYGLTEEFTKYTNRKYDTLHNILWAIINTKTHLHEFIFKNKIYDLTDVIDIKQGEFLGNYLARTADAGRYINFQSIFRALERCVKLKSIYIKGQIHINLLAFIPIIESNLHLHNIVLTNCSYQPRGGLHLIPLLNILVERGIHLSLYPMSSCPDIFIKFNSKLQCIPDQCERFADQFNYTKSFKLSSFNFFGLIKYSKDKFDMVFHDIMKNPRIKTILFNLDKYNQNRRYKKHDAVKFQQFTNNISTYPNISKDINLYSMYKQTNQFHGCKLEFVGKIFTQCLNLREFTLPRNYNDPAFLPILISKIEILKHSAISRLNIPVIQQAFEIYQLLTILQECSKIEDFTFPQLLFLGENIGIEVEYYYRVPEIMRDLFSSRLKRLNLCNMANSWVEVTNIPFLNLLPNECRLEYLNINFDPNNELNIISLLEFLGEVKSLKELHLGTRSNCSIELCKMLRKLNLSELALKTNWNLRDHELVRELANALLGPYIKCANSVQSIQYRRLQNLSINIERMRTEYMWKSFLQIILSNYNLKRLIFNYQDPFPIPFKVFSGLIKKNVSLPLEVLHIGINFTNSGTLKKNAALFTYLFSQMKLRSVKLMFRGYNIFLELQNAYILLNSPFKIKVKYYGTLSKKYCNKEKSMQTEESIWIDESHIVLENILSEWIFSMKAIANIQIIPSINLNEEYLILENIPTLWEEAEIPYLVNEYNKRIILITDFWEGISKERMEYLVNCGEERFVASAIHCGKEAILEICIQELIRKNQIKKEAMSDLVDEHQHEERNYESEKDEGTAISFQIEKEDHT